jgi:large subunit ribosomal protein L25
MEKITLEVTQGVYATAKDARNAKRIPMIYYGKGVKPTNFSADYQDFRRIYKKTGKSAIITIINENKQEFPVLVHEIQYHPVSDNIIHVDIMAVDLNKTLTTKIPFVFVGISAAVKDLGGTLVHSKDGVMVECLPKDLIHEIEVDITPLVDFHCVIRVSDLKIPANIKVLDAPSINVATVSAPRLEEVEVKPVAVEGEVPAEGEAAEAKTEEGAEAKKAEPKKEEKGGKGGKEGK